MKLLVIIPTYNERENIRLLVPALFAATAADSAVVSAAKGTEAEVSANARAFLSADACEILIVDDNSPDGTAAAVHELQKEFPRRLHLLKRPRKEGLGKAYVAGFLWGLQHSYDVFVEMDADFSHRPRDLKALLAPLRENDFVVGSRYVGADSARHRGLGRQIISWGGSLYSRMILGYPLRDWTGGFNVWKRTVVEKIDLSSLGSEGYGFQIELKYRALKKGFRGIEIPIVFEERRAGHSKMSLRIIIEAFYRVWIMRFF